MERKKAKAFNSILMNMTSRCNKKNCCYLLLFLVGSEIHSDLDPFCDWGGAMLFPVFKPPIPNEAPSNPTRAIRYHFQDGWNSIQLSGLHTTELIANQHTHKRTHTKRNEWMGKKWENSEFQSDSIAAICGALFKYHLNIDRNGSLYQTELN